METVGADLCVSPPELPSQTIEIYTTRPDTIFGASFIAISANHPLAIKLGENDEKIQKFIDECNSENSANAGAQDLEPLQEKKGIFSDLKVKHPFKEHN